MNRKERRERGQKTGVKTYCISQDQLDAIKREAYEKAMADLQPRIEASKNDAMMIAFKMVLAIPVLVLHDKWGFGQHRLRRFLGYVETWVKAINDDPETLKEVIETAEAEAGYSLEIVE